MIDLFLRLRELYHRAALSLDARLFGLADSFDDADGFGRHLTAALDWFALAVGGGLFALALSGLLGSLGLGNPAHFFWTASWLSLAAASLTPLRLLAVLKASS